MFEKIGQSAEKVVRNVSVSRRGFLGKAAKVAAGMGAALAALAAFPADAQAGNKHRCIYFCPTLGGYVDKWINENRACQDRIKIGHAFCYLFGDVR